MRRKSFTLLELLIVLIIIGVVAGVAIPLYEGYVYKTQAAEAKAVLRQLANSLWRYYTEAGKWPTQDEGFSKCDIQPPQSKYFIYQYICLYTSDKYRIEAFYIKRAPKPADVRSYAIYFTSKIEDVTDPGKGYCYGKKMDNTYYIAFTYTTNYGDEYDWDGNLVAPAAVITF